MSKNVSRSLRVILVAGLCAVLLPAAVASAGSFKNGTGKLTLNAKVVKKLKKKGVKAGKSVSFSYSSGAAPFIQINMVNGQATSLSLGGSLKIKAGKTKVKLTNFTLNGGVLSANLGKKRIGFTLSGGSTTTPPAPHSISVTVSNVNVKLTKAGAKALNKALSKKGAKVNAFKKGTFATLGYTGTDRQLLEVGGSGPSNESVTCLDNTTHTGPSQTAAKDGNNMVHNSYDEGATLDPTACPHPPDYGVDYNAASTGVIDGLTGFGHIDVAGRVTSTCTDPTTPGTHCTHGASAQYFSPEFVLSSTPTVSAQTVIGRETVLTVQPTSTPSLVETPNGGSFSLPSSTLFFTAFTATVQNNTFGAGPPPSFQPYCPTASCTTPDEYGTSSLTVQLK